MIAQAGDGHIVVAGPRAPEDIRIENADWRLVCLQITPNRFAHAQALGRISGLVFRDIQVTTSGFARPGIVRGHDGEHRISDLTFENLRINGRPVHSPEEGDFRIDPATTRSVRFLVGRAQQTGVAIGERRCKM